MGISRVGKMWSWMRYERFTYYVFVSMSLFINCPSSFTEFEGSERLQGGRGKQLRAI